MEGRLISCRALFHAVSTLTCIDVKLGFTKGEVVGKPSDLLKEEKHDRLYNLSQAVLIRTAVMPGFVLGGGFVT